jgi:hypothetical protein
MSLPIQPVKVCAECEQPTADYYAVNPRTGEHSKGEVYCLECYERGVRRQLHKEWDRKRALAALGMRGASMEPRPGSHIRERF